MSAYGYDQYTALAKTVAHGIALHKGRHLGAFTMAASALMCLGIVFWCVTGPLMWWRRRPRGPARLGPPRAKMPMRATPLLIVLLADRLLLRRVPAVARCFDVRT